MCSEYKHVVLLSHIDAYLEDEGKHEAVKADRARIVQAVQAIRGLKPNRVELNYLVFPRASNIPPHSHITRTQDRRVTMSTIRPL
jgi:hypothetical protein